MTDRDALLKAILAQPDEDMPRLMYADWLTENGHESRGEFIRVQCELARMPEGDELTAGPYPEPIDPLDASEKRCRQCYTLKGRCRRHELMRRERQLWSMSLGWASPFNGSFDWFSRGFIRHFIGKAQDWLTHADIILAQHPVEEVTLTTMPELEVLNLSGTFDICRSLRGRKTDNFQSVSMDYVTQHSQIELALLKAEWPTIRTWNLPPELSREMFRNVRENLEFIAGDLRGLTAAPAATSLGSSSEPLFAAQSSASESSSPDAARPAG